MRVVGSANGRLWGHPHEIVLDAGNMVLCYMPEGVEIGQYSLSERRHLPPYRSRMLVLRVFWTQRPYSVWLVWDAGTGTAPHWPWFDGRERFRGWKIDLHSLPVLSDRGIDFTDDALDVVVSPDGFPQLKDKGVLDDLVQSGVYSASDRGEIVRTGTEVSRLAASRAPPFDESLVSWEPRGERCDLRLPDDWHLYGNPERNLRTGRPFSWRFRGPSGGSQER